ncbi:hypothetical protein [Lentzea californiensis]|uniref:hypothetical protein n=1 Tax=Lentzea californiensis TaxID=438851 RepID=UPI002164A465|nr:hypothetical protein [Lentzea californiensis]MCR3748139.1 hypothetical protein [Lentzea californiensis]
MKDGINWVNVGSGERFEKIVSTLLSTLHPESERIDGSGGDGGRDHQLRSGDELHIWQSKWYVDRLSKSRSRKRKILESLDAAAESKPSAWSLVTPMIPNRTEREWFEDVSRNYSFPLVWRGGDWLEANLAQHPSIVRHFMGAEEEYVNLLRELREEQAACAEIAVHGMEAARPRIELLAAKIDDSNPFYRVDFSVENGRIVNARLRPKYRDAEKDSPVTMQFTVLAGDTQPGMIERLKSAIEWGERIELSPSDVRDFVISGPPGFEASHDSVHIQIGPVKPEKIDLNGRIVLQDPIGKRLASLPIRWSTRVAGTRGITIFGSDLSGVVKVQLKVIPEDRRFTLNLSYEWSKPRLPGAILPILRFQQHSLPVNTITVSLDELTTRPIPAPESISIPAEVVQFAEDLERIQAVLGEPFPMPHRWTATDIKEARRVVEMLEGRRVVANINHVKVSSKKPKYIREAFIRTPGSLRMSTGDPYVAKIAGNDLELGAHVIYVPSAELVEGATRRGTTNFRIVPSEGTDIEVELGEIPEP